MQTSEPCDYCTRSAFALGQLRRENKRLRITVYVLSLCLVLMTLSTLVLLTHRAS